MTHSSGATREGFTDQAPLPQDVVLPLLRTIEAQLVTVLREAISGLRATATSSPSEFAQLSAGARGMIVADFMRRPALRIFGSVPGAEVDLRHNYPWVSLAGGQIQIRFKKLQPDLSIASSDSDRAQMLAYHLGDPCLPGMEPATVLSAGYVLDETGANASRYAVVCHVGGEVLYHFDLSTEGLKHGAVSQLPVIPLSAPLIRSAQRQAQASISRTPRQA